MNTVQSSGGGHSPGSLSKKDSQAEELVLSTPNQRNWRGILIAVLVIVAVLGLIVFSIFLLSPEDESARNKGRKLVLEDVLGRALRPRQFNSSWLSDTELVYRDAYGGLSILNAENMTTRVLMTNSTFRQLNAQRCIVSHDASFVLLLTDEKSDGAVYHVYEVATRNNFLLSPRESKTPTRLQTAAWAPKGAAVAFVHENDLYYKPKVFQDLVVRVTNTGRIGLIYNGVPDWLYSSRGLKDWGRSMVFSPDGANLAYLTYNDTTVGEYRYSYFGDKLLYPEVKTLRYPKVNTANPDVSLHVVNLSRSNLKFLTSEKVKPPQAVLSITNSSPLNASLDWYLGGLDWESKLVVTWIDRNQNIAITGVCSSPNYHCQEVLAEHAETNLWVEPLDPPIFSKKVIQLNNIKNLAKSNVNSLSAKTNESQKRQSVTGGKSAEKSNQATEERTEQETNLLLQRLQVRDGIFGNYRHLCFIAGGRITPITMGRYEVLELLGWDEERDFVYVIATPPSRPGERQLYRVPLLLTSSAYSGRSDFNTTRPVDTYEKPQCLTCPTGPYKQIIQYANNRNISIPIEDPHEPVESRDITKQIQETEEDDFPFLNILSNYIHPAASDVAPDTDECLYNEIFFSPGFSYYVQRCLGPSAPGVYLVDAVTNTRIAVLDSGNILRQRVANIAAPQIKTFEVEIQDGYHAQVRLYLPPGLKEEEDAAFPLILHVDAWPGAQLVTQRFSVDWCWYLSGAKGFLVAQIDARGSGAQGQRMRSEVKGKLGSVDAEDQLAVLTYLRDTLKFIDASRVAAWGWGYGGYVAAMMLAQDSQSVLQCAASVNPPTNWIYQDTFFAERYLGRGLAVDSFRSYEEADLTKRAGNLNGRDYMILHGSADTLVHSQHALSMVRALTEQAVIFRHQMYPDEDHNLIGVQSHVYRQLEAFFDDCFGPTESGDWDPTGGFLVFRQ